MKAGHGKHKGSAFEREICKGLSLWVSGGRRDDLFWRSSMSGGRATVRGKKGAGLDHIAGDICAIHSEGEVLTDRIFIECKHYKDLNYVGFLLKGTGPIAAFWTKAIEQAGKYGKLPVLILKQNLLPVMVLTYREDAKTLCDLHGDLILFGGLGIFPLDSMLKSRFPYRKRIIK